MFPDVHKFINGCIECQREKGLPRDCKYRTNLPDFAFHTVSVDIVGPFQPSSSGNRFIIVAIEKLTKRVEATPVQSASDIVTSKFLLHKIIYRHGCPQRFLTDNGTNFTACIIPILNEMMA